MLKPIQRSQVHPSTPHGKAASKAILDKLHANDTLGGSIGAATEQGFTNERT